MKLFLTGFIILMMTSVHAQEETVEAAPAAEEVPVTTTEAPPPKLSKPLGRVKSSTGVNNESSSFLGDPDNLDPLNPNRDNLKDDNEPVLEDIKSVLNAPKKKKKPAEPAPVAPAAPEAAAAPAVPVEAPVEPPPPEIAPPAVVETAPPAPGLAADDPDLILEKKFNKIFKRYNINPTPDDVWAAASSKQTARLYEVQKGDTLWSISKILFGDPNFWPKLWALNKQGILNPHFINPKMKIYFYEGDEENAPTLSVGELAKTEEPEEPAAPEAETPVAETPVEAVAEPPKPEDPNSPESKPHVAYVKRPPSRPTPLPPSLPISRNEKYFGSDKKIEQQIEVDLGESPEFPLQINNDIVVTDEAVKTDIGIEITEVSKFRFNADRILKDIKFEGALAAEYDIYEELEKLPTSTGIKHVYRLYGHAQPYQSKYLKVTDCSCLITTDLVLLPKDKMKEMNTRKVSDTPEAHLIGGPDVREQRLFEKLQYAFVDFGAAAFSPGQDYNTISQLTDQVNAEFKIVEKYGSYAVVLLTNVVDMVEVGDKVVTK